VPYRTLRSRAYVESLQTGSFKRAVLAQVGPFDEALAVVEDLDMNTRIRKAGYKLLLDPSIRFWYLPRPSLSALWRQIYAVGLVKARILRKHPDIFKWKYVLPTAFVGALALASALVLLRRPEGAWFLLAYATVVAGFAVTRIPRLKAGALRLLLIVPVLHVGYGLGFLSGATETFLGRASRPPGAP
jgi:succinoglycan biosynthesis protein ExoA